MNEIETNIASYLYSMDFVVPSYLLFSSVLMFFFVTVLQFLAPDQLILLLAPLGSSILLKKRFLDFLDKRRMIFWEFRRTLSFYNFYWLQKFMFKFFVSFCGLYTYFVLKINLLPNLVFVAFIEWVTWRRNVETQHLSKQSRG